MEWKNAFTGESDSGEIVLECPDCGSAMHLKDTRLGRFYGCSQYPECRASHGCHPDGSPMGTPADKATREARQEAHRWFDILWESGQFTRGKAYRMLQGFMRMDQDECHIGKFSFVQCKQVVMFARSTCLLYGLELEKDVEVDKD
jgi:ssDNA-binding Zn-finger/Zn-ribbon topoisomerase 1